MDQVRILRNDDEAKLVFDDMRREILRLLAKESLSTHKLSKILGLSSPTVGHHLEALKRAELVRIVGTEAESHGIVQKFYSATAQVYIIETRRLSPTVMRYFMPARIERTRGMLSALALNLSDGYALSSKIVESITEELARHVLEAAEPRKGLSADQDPERVVNEIYTEALSRVIRAKPNLFPHTSLNLPAHLRKNH